MFRKILCPIDFSAGSELSLHTAFRLAKRVDAELCVVHVLEALAKGLESSPWSQDEVQGSRPSPALAEAEAREALDKMVAALGGGVLVTTRIVFGQPADAVITLAQEQGFDLIVMATHGRTGFRRLVLGSVAESVLRNARCPVMTVSQKVGSIPPRHD